MPFPTFCISSQFGGQNMLICFSAFRIFVVVTKDEIMATNNNNKLVAYLDVLGFSNAVNQDIDDAISVLTRFNTISSQSIVEDKIHPVSSYDPHLQNLATRTSVDSFNLFIPFSDSVFISANDCSRALIQIANFVYESFRINIDVYLHPQTPTDPTLSKSIGVGLDKQGNTVVKNIATHEPPVLLRGGVSYGEAYDLKMSAILNGEPSYVKSIAGKAVVKAVRLEEKKVKGPRIIFTDDVFNMLDTNTLKYCRPIPEIIDNENPLFEILWPALTFIPENGFQIEFCQIYKILDAAINLWIPYRDNVGIAKHYENFIEMTLASAIQISDKCWNKKSDAIDLLDKHMTSKNLNLYDFIEL